MTTRSPTEASPQPTGAPPAPAGDLLPGMLARALGAACWRLLLVAALVGVVVFGATDWLPPARLSFFGLGVGAALLATMFALLVHGRLLDRRREAPYAGDGRLLGSRLQSLLAAAFALKLGMLVLGMLALRQAGAKFDDTATFGVTFVAAGLVAQLSAAGHLARALQRRPQAVPVAGAPSPRPRNQA